MTCKEVLIRIDTLLDELATRHATRYCLADETIGPDWPVELEEISRLVSQALEETDSASAS